MHTSYTNNDLKSKDLFEHRNLHTFAINENDKNIDFFGKVESITLDMVNVFNNYDEKNESKLFKLQSVVISSDLENITSTINFINNCLKELWLKDKIDNISVVYVGATSNPCLELLFDLYLHIVKTWVIVYKNTYNVDIPFLSNKHMPLYYNQKTKIMKLEVKDYDYIASDDVVNECKEITMKSVVLLICDINYDEINNTVYFLEKQNMFFTKLVPYKAKVKVRMPFRYPLKVPLLNDSILNLINNSTDVLYKVELGLFRAFAHPLSMEFDIILNKNLEGIRLNFINITKQLITFNSIYRMCLYNYRMNCNGLDSCFDCSMLICVVKQYLDVLLYIYSKVDKKLEQLDIIRFKTNFSKIVPRICELNTYNNLTMINKLFVYNMIINAIYKCCNLKELRVMIRTLEKEITYMFFSYVNNDNQFFGVS